MPVSQMGNSEAASTQLVPLTEGETGNYSTQAKHIEMICPQTESGKRLDKYFRLLEKE